MKIHPYPLALPVLLALAACRPGAADYTETEAPKLVRLDSAPARSMLGFAAGSSRLAAGDGRGCGPGGKPERSPPRSRDRLGGRQSRSSGSAHRDNSRELCTTALSLGRPARRGAAQSGDHHDRAPYGHPAGLPQLEQAAERTSPTRWTAISAARRRSISRGWWRARPIWPTGVRSGPPTAGSPRKPCCGM